MMIHRQDYCSGVTDGGGGVFHREILLTYWERRGKGKNGQKKLEIVKGKVENSKWSTKMGIFYREKAFHAGKKSGKMTLPPLKDIPLTPMDDCREIVSVFAGIYQSFVCCECNLYMYYHQDVVTDVLFPFPYLQEALNAFYCPFNEIFSCRPIALKQFSSNSVTNDRKIRTYTHPTHKTNKQTNKQTNKHTHKQTNEKNKKQNKNKTTTTDKHFLSEVIFSIL